MHIIIAGDEPQKAELAVPKQGVTISWVPHATAMLQYPAADGYIDLLFDGSAERVAVLQSLLPAPVIINSVSATLEQTHPFFIRINAWPTFLSRPILEGSAAIAQQAAAAAIFQLWQQQVTWLPDEPGFVTPRIISMIINEAYMALAEGVSTAEEIDKAMKLGTHYPYGPFEWGDKIGLKKIVHLLNTLAIHQPHYRPCSRLLEAAARS